MLVSIASSCSWLSRSQRMRCLLTSPLVRLTAAVSNAFGGAACAFAHQRMGNFSIISSSCLLTASILELVGRSRLMLNNGWINTVMKCLECLAFIAGISLMLLASTLVPGWLGWCIGFYACVRLFIRLAELIVPDLMEYPFHDPNLDLDHSKISRGDFVSVVSFGILSLVMWSVCSPSSFARYTRPFQALAELHFFLKETKLL